MTPKVSVIMPVLNEARHLAAAVRAIYNQSYAEPFEVVLAIGPCVDQTWEVATRLQSEYSTLKLVENPSGRTPDALNAAIAHAAGDIVIRVDGHAELPANYIDTAVRILHETGAANVGGIMDAQGQTNFEQAVAFAMKSKFGVGAAAFHVGGLAGETDTVYLGCFQARVLREVGGYDPKMTRAQDWEMNHRIRALGHKIWFTPELKVTYRPRSSLQALAKQYFQYGQWRREVIRMHPATVRGKAGIRYLVPPAALVSNLIGLISLLLGSQSAWWLLGTSGLAAYSAAVLAVSSHGLSRIGRAGIWLPAVFVAMHATWGAGFIRGVSR